MAHRKAKYDSACYYGDRLLGRCTVADGEAFSAMMETCGGNAERVLREYAYFSPELKAILEKAAAIQATENQRQHQNQRQPHSLSLPGVFAPPTASPWGEVDYCEALCPGVYLVSTPGHGGVMVANNMAEILSPAARKCGQKQNGFLCYEEDCGEAVVFRELLDKKLWVIPERVKDKAAFEESINRSLRQWNPDYWRSREQGRKNAPLSKHEPAPAPSHTHQTQNTYDVR